MNMKKSLPILVVLILTSSLLFAAIPTAVPELEDPSGREVAAYGQPGEVSGTLKKVSGEWYVECDGTLYELHMGIYGEANKEILKDGAAAVVNGFIYQNHIAPTLVKSGTIALGFWSANRTPLWSGNGNGNNRVAVQGERAPARP